jgi:hypothetical protein
MKAGKEPSRIAAGNGPMRTTHDHVFAGVAFSA